MRCFLTALTFLAIFAGCGSSDAPPLSIPAPAPAKIRISSPNDDGLVTVSGSAGAVTGNYKVRITNLTASGSATLQWVKAQAQTSVETVAAADGSFAAEIAANKGDEIEIISIDPNTNKESTTLTSSVPEKVPPLSFSPRAITTNNADQAYAIGVESGSGIVAIVNLQTGELSSTFNLSTNDPQAIDYDPTQGKLVIADPTQGVVLFVDLTDTSSQNTVVVTGAQSVAVDTSTNQVLVGTTNDNASVVIIDLGTEAVRATGMITNANNPTALYEESPAVDAKDGIAVIVSTFDDGSSQITTKDLATLLFTNQEVVASSHLQGIALINNTRAVAIDKQGNQALFADLTGASIVTSVAVGSSPRQIAIDTINNQAFVTNFDDHTVSLINIQTKEVSETKETGINPQGVAHSEGQDVTIVCNTGDQSVTILP